MAQDIVYTLGIIITVLLLLLFLRSILLRRQRAQVDGLQFPATTWQVHSTHGMDVVRPEAAVINPPAFSRSRTQGSDSRDQLPRYEAPPPGYDAVVKDLERRDSLRQGEERGEPSRADPPGYDGHMGETVIIIDEPSAVAPGPIQAPPRTAATDRGRLFKVDVRRAWSGLGR